MDLCIWMSICMCVISVLVVKGVTTISTPVSHCLASCRRWFDISIDDIPHIWPKRLLFEVIQVTKFLLQQYQHLCFGCKICTLLYTAMEFHMQGQKGSGHTWNWSHDSQFNPSWWKWCCYNHPFVTTIPRLPSVSHGLKPHLITRRRCICMLM